MFLVQHCYCDNLSLKAIKRCRSQWIFEAEDEDGEEDVVSAVEPVVRVRSRHAERPRIDEPRTQPVGPRQIRGLQQPLHRRGIDIWVFTTLNSLLWNKLHFKSLKRLNDWLINTVLFFLYDFSFRVVYSIVKYKGTIFMKFQWN